MCCSSGSQLLLRHRAETVHHPRPAASPPRLPEPRERRPAPQSYSKSSVSSLLSLLSLSSLSLSLSIPPSLALCFFFFFSSLDPSGGEREPVAPVRLYKYVCMYIFPAGDQPWKRKGEKNRKPDERSASRASPCVQSAVGVERLIRLTGTERRAQDPCGQTLAAHDARRLPGASPTPTHSPQRTTEMHGRQLGM